MTYEQIVELVQKNLKKTAAKKMKNHVAVQFDIYGEGEGAFYVEVKEGVITAAPYEYYDRDAKVLITADELIKIVEGKKTAEESYSEGILMVEGNVEAAKELLGLIKTPAKKSTAKKETTKKAPAKKSTEKKETGKKETSKKAPAKKTTKK